TPMRPLIQPLADLSMHAPFDCTGFMEHERLVLPDTVQYDMRELYWIERQYGWVRGRNWLSRRSASASWRAASCRARAFLRSGGWLRRSGFRHRRSPGPMSGWWLRGRSSRGPARG